MLEKIILYIMTEHRGKAIGITLGLVASILFVSYGFWQTIFIAFCILAGYQISNKIDEQVDLEAWVKNLFKNRN